MNLDILQKINAVLATCPDIKVAILYGSFAKGTEKSTSDIDLGVAADKVLGINQLVEIQNKLSNATSREIDLIDLNAATGTVFKESLTSGVTLLKRDDSIFANIMNRMLFEQADFEVIRNRILESNRKKVFE